MFRRVSGFIVLFAANAASSQPVSSPISVPTAPTNAPVSSPTTLETPGSSASPDKDGRQSGPNSFRRGSLFISPAGKPFRAQPGDPYPVAVWFSEADTDHDGKLTIGEMRDDASRFFAELDTNHDGEIGSDEVTHYEMVVAPEVHSGDAGGGGGGRNGGGRKGGGRGGPGGSHGGGMGGGRGMGGGGMGSDSSEESDASSRPQAMERLSGAAFYSLIPIPEPVTSTDTDISGVIRVEKFRAAAERRFHMLDAAGKGYLTLAELPKTAVQQTREHLKRNSQKRTHSD